MLRVKQFCLLCLLLWPNSRWLPLPALPVLWPQSAAMQNFALVGQCWASVGREHR